GNGTVNYSVASNSGGQRSGSISVGGQTFSITQAGICIYSLGSTSRTVASSGGSFTVSVTADAGCSWGAASNATWVSVTSGSPGSGSGTVGYSVDVNTGPQRVGTMTIAGQTFTVTQSTGCSYTITPTSQTFAIEGGTGSIDVATGASCGWSATTASGWIGLTGATGTGNGTVNYSVASNSGAQRSGSISVGGQTFNISQAGTCSYSISPVSRTHGPSSATGSITVTTATGCGWSA